MKLKQKKYCVLITGLIIILVKKQNKSIDQKKEHEKPVNHERIER